MCRQPETSCRRHIVDTLLSEHTGGVFRSISAVRKYSKHRDEQYTNFNPDWFLVK